MGEITVYNRSFERTEFLRNAQHQNNLCHKDKQSYKITILCTLHLVTILFSFTIEIGGELFALLSAVETLVPPLHYLFPHPLHKPLNVVKFQFLTSWNLGFELQINKNSN